MSNFAGYRPTPIPRWGSQVEWDDGLKMPFGAASVVRNMIFHNETVETRPAMVNAFSSGLGFPITGMGMLEYQGNGTDQPAKYLLLYDSNTGNIGYEHPAGSGIFVWLAPPLPGSGNQVQMHTAFDRMYYAQSDLVTGKVQPMAFSGKRQDVWPISNLPLGSSWQAAYQYVVGDIITPTTPNGLWYRCTTAGLSGNAEPVWSTADSGTTASGTATFTENTPFFGIALPPPTTAVVTRAHLAGALAASKDVYVKVSFYNAGDTGIASCAAGVIVNTVLNDGVSVARPPIPSWADNTLLTGWGVWAAQVSTGAPAPADTDYVLIADVPRGTATYIVTTIGMGTAGSDNNTAYLIGPGNVCSGVRWAIVLFENFDGEVDGCTDALPLYVFNGTDGYQIYGAKIPLGRANTRRRIIAFTSAGDSNAGRYFSINKADNLFPSTNQTGASIVIIATTIEDNVTTIAGFNFPDFYLVESPTEYTDNFDKLLIPPCAHIYYSESLNRLILTGVLGYSSAHWISDAGDPGTFRLPLEVCALQVAEKNHGITVGWCEVSEQNYSLKTGGIYRVTRGGQDPTKPAQWDVTNVWKDSGPAGPRAFDTRENFLIFADEKGGYIFNGSSATYITPELVKTWGRINRAAKQTIEVHVDEEKHEVHFLLPLDGATKPNYRARLMLREWSQIDSEPIILTRRGTYVANNEGRRWSVEPLARTMAIVNRDLATPVDRRIDHRQVLYASQTSGKVFMERPDFYQDDDDAGTGKYIDWQFRTVPIENPNLAVIALGGMVVASRGSGKLNVSANCNPDKNNRRQTTQNLTAKKMIVLNPNASTTHDLPVRAFQGEQVDLSLTGDGTPGSWAQLQISSVFYKQQWAQRRA